MHLQSFKCDIFENSISGWREIHLLALSV
ncbi:unnamed protein product [Spirodela intermedia]|uniref:Uncharacterized protein n=2 Tax=Spirodela intermedia TaxID=51605 RepID=A0A7I8JDB8_SPIIN|nr:unnamed protein product [Spirodela intermedia]CAA6668154.1 unnamed protein product [Spirodela intermedia]CAA7404987.1 unnamed protein product [Spirodela intermedia]